MQIKKLKVIKDDRGFLMEMLRSDDKIFQKFGQVYLTFCKYGVAKAWHYHKLQDDYLVCLQGKTLVGLYDARKKSKTYKEINKFILMAPEKNGCQNIRSYKMTPRGKIALLKIPKGVVHGFAALTKDGAKILNLPTKTYNYKKPDEYRLPWNTEKIPFKWPKSVKHGG